MLKDFMDETDLEDLKEFDQEPDIVKKALGVKIGNVIADCSEYLFDCESPIEKVFSIYFQDLFRKSKLYNKFEIAEVEVQKGFTTSGFSFPPRERTYVVDFFVSLLNRDSKCYEFVIECDGHDFHEKTKEQAANDRKRERELMLMGFTVIRFTGSEIVNNPLGCAEEAMKIIGSRVSS